jgi:hypothetical protein
MLAAAVFHLFQFRDSHRDCLDRRRRRCRAETTSQSTVDVHELRNGRKPQSIEATRGTANDVWIPQQSLNAGVILEAQLWLLGSQSYCLAYAVDKL